MSIEVKQLNWHEAGGTSLRGYVTATFDELVTLFGEPELGDFDKSDAEWVLSVDGDVATIYNWRPSEYTVDPKTVTNWHIGGFTEIVADKINTLVKEAK